MISRNEKKKYLPLLDTLRKLNGNDVSNIMDFLTDDAIDHVCECVYNVLHTDLSLSSSKKTRLKKFIKSNCSIHRLKRRKALKQEGKGLPLLLASVIPFLANLFAPK